MGEGTSFGWRGREGKARRRIELKTGGAPSLPPSLCLSPRHQHLRNLSSRSVVIFRTRSPCYFYPRAASVLEIRNGRITRIVISRNVSIRTFAKRGKNEQLLPDVQMYALIARAISLSPGSFFHTRVSARATRVIYTWNPPPSLEN